MKKPPAQLDGADVILWAWSGAKPYFAMPYGNGRMEIFGLAICKYSKGTGIYRFSCNADWEVENDGLYDNIGQAATALSAQYDAARVEWFDFKTGEPWKLTEKPSGPTFIISERVH